MVASATNSKKLDAEVEAAWIQLMRVPEALLGRVQADLKAQGFPPLEWYDVLLELDRNSNGALRQRALGERLLLARYNLSRLVDRLEAEGLVRREACADDARGAVVAITDAGRALRERMWPAYADAVRRHVGERLTAGEPAALERTLRKLA